MSFRGFGRRSFAHVTLPKQRGMLSRMHTTRVALIALLLANSALAQETKRPPITGIAYVRIYARDPAASRRFYTTELLLPEATCPPRL